MRGFGEDTERRRRENRDLLTAGLIEAMLNVGYALRIGQRQDPGPNRDALTDMAHLMTLQQRFQFRLTGEHDLYQFFVRRLQVGQHPDTFQSLDRHTLGLVDDEDNGAAAVALRLRQVMQLRQLLVSLLLADRLGPQLLEDRGQQAVERQIRVVEMDGFLWMWRRLLRGAAI